uniref:Tyrosine-protein kinase receptor n=1 Tax=Monosiga ovata TaxID=81526 RepID=B3XVV8_9EUKA|nr:protein tyrosine kinase [Monosiga ovata]|eukprot:m.228550 g.228550  ORF g.228550 m.228550 type:complete len:785 (+) comp11760_c0_seq1:178-2532(+)
MGKDRKKDRKLYDAVKANDVGRVKDLLQQGADPDAPVGKKGLTSMHRAAVLAHRDIETLLQTHGGTLIRSSTLAKKAIEDAKSDTGTMVTAAPVPEEGAGDASTFVRRDTAEERRPTPLETRMSQLALGAGSSMRMKAKADNRSLADNAPSEWHVQLDGLELSFNSKKDWNFDRRKLQQVRKLGQGTFGVVFEGLAEGIRPTEEKTRVAVKMLSAAGDDIKRDFNKEVEIMKALDAPHNVVRLLGVCTEEEPYLMIMELMERGDLKTLLRENRPKDGPSPLSYQRLALMGADIAEGMSFLAGAHIVHRDLAARNCLVGEALNVKIGDFGMTRDVYHADYYRMTGSAPLPIRWMSPEAIMDGVYSTNSDIWSFGVVLWELVTFAKLPYTGLTNSEVCDQVCEEGYRLPCPRGCPSPFYDLMVTCWREDAEKRGTFTEHQGTLLEMAAVLPATPIEKDKNMPSKTGSGTALVEKPDSSSVAPEPEVEAEDVGAPAEPEYLKEAEKEDDAKLYTDERYSHLDSMSLAIKTAANLNAIQDVVQDRPAAHGIVARTVQEQVAPDAPLAEPAKAAPPALTLPDVKVQTMVSGDSAAASPAPASAPPFSSWPPPNPALAQQRKSLESSTLQAPPPMREFQEKEGVKRRQYQGGSTSKKHLANDNTATALKVREASHATAEKAERDMQMWIEGQLGVELPGSFGDSLRSGEVLCALLNSIKPGLVPKFHKNSKMAFKQMENIGYFLEGCKALGVADTDLFMTVDLFDFANLKQVVICVGALRNRAMSLGMRT